MKGQLKQLTAGLLAMMMILSSPVSVLAENGGGIGTSQPVSVEGDTTPFNTEYENESDEEVPVLKTALKSTSGIPYETPEPLAFALDSVTGTISDPVSKLRIFASHEGDKYSFDVRGLEEIPDEDPIEYSDTEIGGEVTLTFEMPEGLLSEHKRLEIRRPGAPSDKEWIMPTNVGKTFTVTIDTYGYYELIAKTEDEGGGEGPSGEQLGKDNYRYTIDERLTDIVIAVSEDDGLVEFEADFESMKSVIDDATDPIGITIEMNVVGDEADIDGANGKGWYADMQNDPNCTIKPVYNGTTTPKTISYFIPLDKESEAYYAFYEENHGYGDNLYEVQTDGKQYFVQFDIHGIGGEGGGSGLDVCDHEGYIEDGVFVYQGEIHASLAGWTKGYSNDYPVSIELADDGVYDITVEVEDPDEWKEIVNNVSLGDSIDCAIWIDKPDESVGAAYITSMSKIGTDFDIDNIKNQDPNTDVNHDNGARGFTPVFKEQQTSTKILLRPSANEEIGEAYYLVWYSNNEKSGGAYTFSDGEKTTDVEIVRFRHHVKLNDTITIDLDNILPRTAFDTSAVEPEGNYYFAVQDDASDVVTYDKGTLSIRLDPEKMEDLEWIQDNPLITTVQFPENEWARVEVEARDNEATDYNQSSLSTTSVEIESMPVRDGELLTFTSGSFVVRFFDDEDNLQQTYSFTIAVDLLGNRNIYESNGWKPVDEDRIIFEDKLFTQDGKDRGFRIEYAGNGELRTVWTSTEVDLDGLRENEGTNPQVLIVTPPESIAARIVDVKVTQHGSNMRYQNTTRSLEETEAELDHAFVNRVDDESWALHTDYGFMPMAFDVDGIEYAAIQRAEDWYDSCAWYFIDWILDDGSEYKEYYYETTRYANKNEHTMPYIDPETWSELGGTMVHSIDEAFDLDVHYYAKIKSDGDRDALYLTIDALDEYGYSPSAENPLRIMFDYPEGVTYDNHEQYVIELKHFVDGLGCEPVFEEFEFTEEGIYVVLTSCSPFLLEWDADDSSDDKPKKHSSGKSQSIKDLTASKHVAPTVKGTWSSNANGVWRFLKEDGTYAINEWIAAQYYDAYGNLCSSWFRFDALGNMITGWFFDVDGYWYYLNPVSDGTKGMCYLNTITPDGYRVDASGRWIP